MDNPDDVAVLNGDKYATNTSCETKREREARRQRREFERRQRRWRRRQQKSRGEEEDERKDNRQTHQLITKSGEVVEKRKERRKWKFGWDHVNAVCSLQFCVPYVLGVLTSATLLWV